MTLLINRRRLLAGSTALVLFASTVSWADEKKVVSVVTSYSAEVTSRMEAAFEKQYPQYRVQIIWRMPNDALPYLLDTQSPADVYWSASPRTFARLKSEKRLRPLALDLTGLPDHIGHTQLRDADNFYIATEMAAYGFALNTKALDKLGVTAPKDWRDLTDPRLAGQIALPDPAKVGFAPVLLDIILQAYGWQEGWALWSEISGNAVLMGHGASFVNDDVGTGKYALGLSIDFFVVSAIANGAPLTFSYPNHSGINPGHVALMANAPNAEGANAFAQFVLSPTGQAVLTHADIRKLPVLPSAYENMEPSYYRPFAAAEKGELDYDNDAGRNRLGVVTSLFNQFLGYRHNEQAALWQRVKTLEQATSKRTAKQKKRLQQVRSILCAVPLTQAEAESAALQQQFRNRLEGAKAELSDIEKSWQADTDKRIASATALLEKLPL